MIRYKLSNFVIALLAREKSDTLTRKEEPHFFTFCGEVADMNVS